MKPTYHYIDGLCGSGKTEWIIEQAIRTAIGKKNSVILVKSVDLSEEIKKRIKSKLPENPLTRHIQVLLLHHQNSGGSVVKAIITHIKDQEEKTDSRFHRGGEILIITHRAYDLMPWDNFRDWTN